jgi:hypothetical protein
MHAAFQVDVFYVFGKVNTPSNPKKESESEFCKHTLELFTSSTRTPHGVNQARESTTLRLDRVVKEAAWPRGYCSSRPDAKSRTPSALDPPLRC